MTALMSLALIFLAVLASLVALVEPVTEIALAIWVYLKDLWSGPLKSKSSKKKAS